MALVQGMVEGEWVWARSCLVVAQIYRITFSIPCWFALYPSADGVGSGGPDAEVTPPTYPPGMDQSLNILAWDPE